MSVAAAVFLGFLLDCVLGDPERLWHPIMGIGSMISFWKKHLRAWFPDSNRGQFGAGVLLWFVVVIPSWLIPAAILYLAGWLHPALAFVIETLFCWQILRRNRSSKRHCACIVPCAKAICRKHGSMSRGLSDAIPHIWMRHR